MQKVSLPTGRGGQGEGKVRLATYTYRQGILLAEEKAKMKKKASSPHLDVPQVLSLST